MALGKHSGGRKRISRRKGSVPSGAGLDSRTIGTHVDRGSRSTGGKHGRQAASIEDFSVNSLGAVGAVPVQIDANQRKKRQTTLAEQFQGKVHKRHRIVLLVVILLIVAIAIGVGVFAYFKTANAKLDLHPSNAQDTLVAVEEGEPYYVLCCAVMGTPFDKDDTSKMAYMLVHVDSSQRQLTFMTIPANLQVRISNGEYFPLYQTPQHGGDAETVKALASLLDIDISHFAYTTAEKLGELVDAIGGITMDLTEEVDDPNAGIQVIYPGEQELDGQQAEVLLRAQNYNGGFDMTAHNRVAFTLALATRALADDGPGLTTLVGDVGDYVSTDLDAATLLDMGDIFRPIDTVTVYECVLPGYEIDDMEIGETVFVRSRDTWEAMLELIASGQDPNDVEALPANVDPSSFTVEVRNGTASNGAASKLADLLRSSGYVIKGIGNAEDGVLYPETLIVYMDEKYQGAALSIVDEMGTGRAVNGGDFYSSGANVIAIIGQDYIPVG